MCACACVCRLYMPLWSPQWSNFGPREQNIGYVLHRWHLVSFLSQYFCFLLSAIIQATRLYGLQSVFCIIATQEGSDWPAVNTACSCRLQGLIGSWQKTVFVVIVCDYHKFSCNGNDCTESCANYNNALLTDILAGLNVRPYKLILCLLYIIYHASYSIPFASELKWL